MEKEEYISSKGELVNGLAGIIERIEAIWPRGGVNRPAHKI
jgi:hypothetical protein